MSEPHTVELHALKIVGGGVALAHSNGATWMVAGALPGEDIRVLELRRRSGIVEAQTLEVLANAHPARLGIPCPHAGPCGGCDWPHVDPSAGAKLKIQVAADASRSHPDLADRLREAPIQTSPLGYRLRARLHFDPDQGALGFYASRSNSIHPLSDCVIISPRLLEALPRLNHALATTCPIPVDLEWLEDLGGEVAIGALRRSQGGSAPKRELVPGANALQGAMDGLHLLDDSGRVGKIWGGHTVNMDLPISLEVPIGAFFQGNRHLVRPLFDRLVKLVGPTSVPVWDLHGGVGFLAAAARVAARREIDLVEVFAPAAEAARRNLPGATVHIGKTAESVLRRAGRLPKNALVLTDPPRAGMNKDLRQRLAEWKAERILMLACDPATWARDAAFLLDRGYQLTHLELFDLFPSTHHVEILALLEHR
ncbi:MAG: hypothetical protein K8R59_14335 [Thermoanaerobaculales bacterium]|nr:hypothetical protein [Thermoanaerobaculales bacterium]